MATQLPNLTYNKARDESLEIGYMYILNFLQQERPKVFSESETLRWISFRFRGNATLNGPSTQISPLLVLRLSTFSPAGPLASPSALPVPAFVLRRRALWPL